MCIQVFLSRQGFSKISWIFIVFGFVFGFEPTGRDLRERFWEASEGLNGQRVRTKRKVFEGANVIRCLNLEVTVKPENLCFQFSYCEVSNGA